MIKLRALPALLLLLTAALSSCSHNDTDTYTLLGEESYRRPIEDSITRPLLELMDEKELIDLETMRNKRELKKDLIPPFIEGQFVIDTAVLAGCNIEGWTEGENSHPIYLMFSKQNNGTAQFNGKELIDVVQIPSIQIYGWDSTFYASFTQSKRFNDNNCEICVVIKGDMEYDQSSASNISIKNIAYGWIITQAPSTQDSLTPQVGDMAIYYDLDQRAMAHEWLIMAQ